MSMKKRIFIAAHYLEIGGAEISLIGLLNEFDYSKYEVDLFLYSVRGELLPLVPEDVNILPEIQQYAQIEAPLKETIAKGFFRHSIARLKAKYKYRRWAKRNNPKTIETYYQYLDDELIPTLPDLFHLGEYDLAINFIGQKNVIPSKIRARKTISWIHTDMAYTTLDVAREFRAWNAYDYIASISPAVTSSFISLFPSLESKIVEIENILSPDFVRTRADEFDASSEFRGISILSIGRYTHQKNFDNVPDIVRQLVKDGIANVYWYIIGYGVEEELIRKRIQESGMEDYVILLGKKDNPYPYIKACDIYVQPSRYEGKSVTVREAQMLGKPVVVTNYKTATSQIKNGIDGIIVPMDNSGCARGIAKLILDVAKQKAISYYCSTHDFGNTAEVEKIYRLIDE